MVSNLSVAIANPDLRQVHHPNSNSGKMWTAQIQIGKNSQKRFLGADGNYYRNPQQDITHIPVNMGK